MYSSTTLKGHFKDVYRCVAQRTKTYLKIQVCCTTHKNIPQDTGVLHNAQKHTSKWGSC